MPCRIAVLGESIVTGLPRIEIVPEVAGVTPKMRLGDVAAAGADQAGDAEDLAGAQIERDVVEDALQGEVLDRRARPRRSAPPPSGTSG